MKGARDILAGFESVYVTPRAALVVAVPILAVAWLPGFWAWVTATVWLGTVAFALRRDIRSAVGPDEMEVERTLPIKLSIGVPNPVDLTVRNTSARIARILLRETPPARFEGERRAGLGEGGEGGGRRSEGGRITLGPREERTERMRFVPPARGLFTFGPVAVRSLGPLGLAGRQWDGAGEAEAKVYPDITAVHAYALLARKGTLHEIGVRAARHAGTGTEFESLRDYVDGDDYRDIDWKATARRGAPVVRRFEAERSQAVVLAVDSGRLMTPVVDALSKLDRAINAALLLAYLATRYGDNVGLLVFGRDIQAFVPPRKGHRQFLTILEALYSVEGRVEEPDYAGALRYLSARVRRRSLVVLFTELVGTEPSRRLLGVLGGMARRHLPLVVTQRDREMERSATEVPETESDVYRSSIAGDLLQDKAAAVRLLSAGGSLVLDVAPEVLSVAAVNRYLEVKAQGRL